MPTETTAMTRVLRTREELRAALADAPRPIGLVTTMGWLHDGHRELMRTARSENATNRIPSWFRSAATPGFVADWQIGDVVVHTQDDTNDAEPHTDDTKPGRNPNDDLRMLRA